MERNITTNEGDTRVNKCIDTGTSGFAYSIAVTAVLFSALVFGAIVNVFGLQSGDDVYIYLSYATPALTLIVMTAFYFLLTKTDLVQIKGFYNFSFKKRYWAVIALAIVGMMFGLGGLNDLFIEFLGIFGYVPPVSGLPPFSAVSLVLCIVVIAVLPPLAEETVFRGIIQSGLNKSGYMSVILTAAMFSLFHMSPAKTAYQLVVGALFSLVALKSGSVIPTLIVHFLNNLLIILNEYFGIFSFVGGNKTLFVVLGVACLVGTLVIIFTDGERVGKSVTKEEWKDFWLKAAFGFLLAAFIWVLSLFS